MPPEYCSFGSNPAKCRAWCAKEHPKLYQHIYSEEALANTTASLSLEAREKDDKAAEKAARKAESAAQKEEERRKKSYVIIKRESRNKRKFVTSVSGLEAFGHELKKVHSEAVHIPPEESCQMGRWLSEDRLMTD